MSTADELYAVAKAALPGWFFGPKEVAHLRAVAELLAPEDEAHVMAALTGKMPWFKLYTPCMPVRVAVRELFVTSFELGWMPAKRLVVRSSPPA